MRPGITGAAGEIDRLSAGGHSNRGGGPDADDAIAVDDDASVFDWRTAAAVDDADVVEHHRARLRRLGGRDR